MNQYWIRLYSGLLLMLFLAIVPLPWGLVSIRPVWILLFLLYIQFYCSERFNIFFVMIAGLLLDSILSSLMGEHIFALTLVLWFAQIRTRRFLMHSMSIQMFYIGVFSILYCFVLMLINRALGNAYPVNLILSTSIASSLIWPFFKLIADEFYFPLRPKRDWMMF